MSYYTSRQRHYENNKLCFEIACGGSKSASKDILPFKYDGEGKNLVSPIDAVNVALRVIAQWDLAFFDDKKWIALVNTDGKGSKEYFDPHSKRDMDRLQRWAETTLKNMSKCCNCQKPISNTTKAYETSDLPNKIACTENCLASIYRTIFGVEMKRVVSNKDKKKAP